MTPISVFSGIEAFSQILGLEDLLEGRYDNDVNGNPIYIGYSPYPNANPDDAVWFIRKVTYIGESIVRTQLPDDGIQFAYIWTDRTTYFT